MGLITGLWMRGEIPDRSGLYRADDTARALHVPGPGGWHPVAGQPIDLGLGRPIDPARAVAVDGTHEVDTTFESMLPDSSGWVVGGEGRRSSVGYLARLCADRTLVWAALMLNSNPFVGVRFEGATAVFLNDRRNALTIDLDGPDFR